VELINPLNLTVVRVINFSHALSEKATSQLTERFGEVEVINVPVSVDMAQPLGAQVEELLKPVQEHFNGATPVAVVLPGLSVAATLVACAISGLSGSLPLIIELRSNAERVFEVFDVIDAQAFRNAQRVKR